MAESRLKEILDLEAEALRSNLLIKLVNSPERANPAALSPQRRFKMQIKMKTVNPHTYDQLIFDKAGKNIH